jgi:hypothetical protein
MNVYVELMLIDRIDNKRKYRNAVREIQHYIMANSTELHIKYQKN